jgi:hypothetical protein
MLCAEKKTRTVLDKRESVFNSFWTGHRSAVMEPRAESHARGQRVKDLPIPVVPERVGSPMQEPGPARESRALFQAVGTKSAWWPCWAGPVMNRSRGLVRERVGPVPWVRVAWRVVG